MPITYTSKHHSPQDPGGVIRAVIDMGPEFTGPAQDVLVSWMLRLDDGIDPAEAARHLLAAYGLNDGPPKPGALGELVRLLRETADYPSARLRGHLCRPEARPRAKRRRRGR